MKKKFIEVKTRTYQVTDFQSYIDKLNGKSTQVDEGDEWKLAIQEDEENPEPPKSFTSKVFIDPDQIEFYIETFSMESSHKNPDKPKFDSIEINFKNGNQLVIASTLTEFNKKLDEFYSQEGA